MIQLQDQLFSSWSARGDEFDQGLGSDVLQRCVVKYALWISLEEHSFVLMNQNQAQTKVWRSRGKRSKLRTLK